MYSYLKKCSMYSTQVTTELLISPIRHYMYLYIYRSYVGLEKLEGKGSPGNQESVRWQERNGYKICITMENNTTGLVQLRAPQQFTIQNLLRPTKMPTCNGIIISFCCFLACYVTGKNIIMYSGPKWHEFQVRYKVLSIL